MRCECVHFIVPWNTSDCFEGGWCKHSGVDHPIGLLKSNETDSSVILPKFPCEVHRTIVTFSETNVASSLAIRYDELPQTIRSARNRACFTVFVLLWNSAKLLHFRVFVSYGENDSQIYKWGTKIMPSGSVHRTHEIKSMHDYLEVRWIKIRHFYSTNSLENSTIYQ